MAPSEGNSMRIEDGSIGGVNSSNEMSICMTMGIIKAKVPQPEPVESVINNEVKKIITGRNRMGTLPSKMCAR